MIVPPFDLPVEVTPMLCSIILLRGCPNRSTMNEWWVNFNLRAV
jgi:hypothetical protein